MKVLIITEGSKTIGFGHITRCTSLYQAFEARSMKPHLIVNGDETVKSILQETEHYMFNWFKNREKLFEILENSDITIIDSYIADYFIYERIFELSKIAVYIDDNNRLQYPPGIVINGTINASKFNYTPGKGREYLLDTDYIPLRKAFWDIPTKSIHKDIKSCMVTFGGDDLRNLTPKILKALQKSFPHLHKNVVVGKAFENISEIENINDNKIKIFYFPDDSEMANIMLESDIAVSAAGQTLYELARVGVPAIGISVASNQANNAINWQKTGFIEYAGSWNDESLLDNVLNGINALNDGKKILAMSEKGRISVDGRGAQRILEHCLKIICHSEGITLRRAKQSDIWQIFELSNDPIVRSNSFYPEIITRSHHKSWFYNKLNNDDCLFLVAEVGNIFAGQIRFNLEGDEALISLSVTKAFRGLGLGKKLLKKSLEYIKSDFPIIIKVIARVKEENKDSINLFKSCDFKLKDKLLIENQKAVQFVYNGL